MNLLHIGKFYPPYRGGMETYLQDLVEQQVKQGHQVTVLVHNHDWRLLKSQTTIEQTVPGLTVIRQACLRPVFFTPFMIGLNRQVKRLIDEQSIDIIHLHVPNPSLFVLLWNRSAKKLAWVMRWHSDMVTESSSWLIRLMYRCLKPLETALIKNTQKILISTSEYIKKSPQLQKYSARVSVIPLGLNTRKVTVPTAKPLTDKPFRVLSLGRLSYYKNHRMLITAMRDLPDMHLSIAGGGGLHGELQAYIENQQLADRVTLTGPVTEQEKHQLLADCHVFCLASNDRAESYGMVLLEAMARNKIILSADTAGSGMRWLAHRYPKGFTFHSEDVSDLVEKLEFIRRHYHDITQQAVQFDLSIEQTATDIMNLYQQLITKETS